MAAYIFSNTGHAVTVTGGNVIRLAPSVDHSALSAYYITGGSAINKDTRNIKEVANGLLVEDTRTGPSGNETDTLEYTITTPPLTSSSSYTTLLFCQLP